MVSIPAHHLAELHTPVLKKDWFSPIPPTPQTPGEWFSLKFPDQAEQFGAPFLELKERYGEFEKTTAIALNHDFFAASLSQSRLGHKVVYVESEMAWYYYEPRTQCFQPTTSEKLQTLLRAQFMKCCEAMNLEVSKLTLFDHFRSDITTRAILQRAKSILSVDDTFFSPTSKNHRSKGPEVNERIARNFAEQLLVRDSSRILTVTQAYVHFCEFLKSQQQAPLHRFQFKSLMAEVIREQFDLGLRHDLKEGEGKQQAGWKGLRVA